LKKVILITDKNEVLLQCDYSRLDKATWVQKLLSKLSNKYKMRFIDFKPFSIKKISLILITLLLFISCEKEIIIKEKYLPIYDTIFVSDTIFVDQNLSLSQKIVGFYIFQWDQNVPKQIELTSKNQAIFKNITYNFSVSGNINDFDLEISAYLSAKNCFFSNDGSIIQIKNGQKYILLLKV
jgi:hypothetical protein